MHDIIWQFEHSVECNSHKSFAWAFWTDVSNWERLEGKAVEWIKLHGPFAIGTSGATKTPGQHPYTWTITQLEPERSATIEMPLDGAVFCNIIMMESMGPNRTQITQRLSLAGENAPDFAKGMRTFETSAPQGLKKLAKAIESAYNTV
ncbi:hypothetical protein [Ulvibacterium sp.]|uniref:hypothetical protein n=1 Tax=Ulvibacterium sp. TaxID=2665914 RepID=UPI002626BAAD|nr:hypothetical protein [Ulvibacterium sp.]